VLRSCTLLVFDGVADGPLGVSLEVMSTAARIVRAGLVNLPKSSLPERTRIVSIDGAPVQTAARRQLVVDGAFNLRGLGAGDAFVLPGLGMPTPREISAALARPDIARARPRLARAAARGVLIGASCSATFVLGAAGVLDGREATTAWWLGQDFKRRFPRVIARRDRMVVRAGRIFTAGAALAHADLMLAIVAETLGPSLAHLIAKYLVLDERASQASYMVLDHLRSADPVISALERFIGSNLRRQLGVPEMARATATSPRTLARKLEQALGTTPLRFAQRIRVAQAVHLLETTPRTVDEVATAVGYADAAAFRRVFRRETGQSPHRARRSSR
jgi:transcriptional regulator GlxA family with amidase domain